MIPITTHALRRYARIRRTLCATWPFMLHDVDRVVTVEDHSALKCKWCGALFSINERTRVVQHLEITN